eukprot:COSAG02_NODE_32181_length_520_cov_6.610451_1_plen_125_part_10
MADIIQAISNDDGDNFDRIINMVTDFEQLAFAIATSAEHMGKEVERQSGLSVGPFSPHHYVVLWLCMTVLQAVRKQSDFPIFLKTLNSLRVAPRHLRTRRALLEFQKPILCFRPRPIRRCIVVRE